MSIAPSDFDRQRATFGIAVILSMALLAIGTLGGYRGLPRRKGEIDAALLNERRFEGLRSVLPSRGTVGYLSDNDAVEGYYLAQYFLAPLIIAPGAQPDIVVANCASGTAIPALATAYRLVIVRDFGNGVALLRRAR